MWRRENTYRRIKKEELFKRGPYWSSFLMGSLCVHALFFMISYGPLMSFITGLQRHDTEQTPLMYVTLEKFKSRFADTDEPAIAAIPAVSAAGGKKAQGAVGAQTGAQTPDKDYTELPHDTETVTPSAGEINGAVSEPLAGPGKEDGITFIRGDILTVEEIDEKQNLTEAKERSHTLARLETADNRRFSEYSTIKDSEFRVYTTRAIAEPEGSSAIRPRIDLKMPSSTSVGINPTVPDKIGKETSSHLKLPSSVLAAPSRQKDMVSAKAPFSYVTGGASALPGPAFSELSQKKPALPGRVFAAEVNQAEPTKARAINSGEGDAARPVPPAVRLTSPVAGQSEKKVVAVKGKVSGYGITSVVLTFGARQRELLVRDGEFESEVVLDEGRNLIRVDTSDVDGKTAADTVEVIYAVPVDPAKTRIDLVVRVEHNAPGAILSTSHKWAPHPLSKGPGQAVAPEFKVDGGSKGGTVSVSKAVPGIYTIGVGYDTTASGPAEATFEVTVFGYDPARRKNRKIGPVRLEGKGFIPAVRLLMPEGVFWEDDGWFSGVMESGRTTTKYKMPEGIVWKERD